MKRNLNYLFPAMLCYDSTQTNPVEGFFVNIVTCEQDGIINRKQLLLTSVSFLTDVFLAGSVIIAETP